MAKTTPMYSFQRLKKRAAMYFTLSLVFRKAKVDNF